MQPFLTGRRRKPPAEICHPGQFPRPGDLTASRALSECRELVGLSLFDATLANGVGCVSRKRLSFVLWERLAAARPGGSEAGCGEGAGGTEVFTPRLCWQPAGQSPLK